ncbi:MAG: chemotaxis protein CheW [Pseudomonas sp.]|uniref:chemotaxis protein CheW n=1 Tax=Pseudomonas abieticivorans TaxID=2931382 RepID=UPI0020C08715|nr:chemotaxis protein CheW [Pseudomonas sp. PIA16]MDE1168497.1 chemotaxis protein CheW [Pseudomonas sp.]
MLDHAIGRRTSLTGLLLPLSDRCLLLPNVAVAELIGYQFGQPAPDAPAWNLGQIAWRNQQLPLINFEAACGAPAVVGERARIVVLNALGDSPLRYIALLIQGVPRSCKLDTQLSYVDVPLAPLERAAVQVGEQVVKVPDLVGLERLVMAGVS